MYESHTVCARLRVSCQALDVMVICKANQSVFGARTDWRRALAVVRSIWSRLKRSRIHPNDRKGYAQATGKHPESIFVQRRWSRSRPMIWLALGKLMN